MWYKGRYVTISRTKDDRTWPPDRSTLVITSVPLVHSDIVSPNFSHSIFSLDRSILDTLILEAREKWTSARDDRIQVYVSDVSVQ
jgi:mitochondrial chaperone BCS1